jgi:predicted nucleic acid-binding protein
MINGKVVDTSVWVPYLRQIENQQTLLINTFIDKNEIITVPIILQEVLQGIKEDNIFNSIKESFLSFKVVEYSNVEAAINAALLYKFLRKKGATIRKPNDCLIAWICIDNNFQLIHNDKDFDNIAKYTSLKIYK